MTPEVIPLDTSPLIAAVEQGLSAFWTDAQVRTAVCKQWGISAVRCDDLIAEVKERWLRDPIDKELARVRLIRLCEDGIRRNLTSKQPSEKQAQSWAKMLAEVLGLVGPKSLHLHAAGRSGVVSVPVRAALPEADPGQVERLTGVDSMIDDIG